MSAGGIAIAGAVVFIIAGRPRYLVLAFGLYAARSALQACIDVDRPMPWREPPAPVDPGADSGLLIAALLAS